MAAQPANSRDSAPASALRAPKPLLAVAIDFGTYASGFAYAPIPQHQPQPCQPHAVPRVSLHTAWPGQPAPDPKTRTAVLYRGRTLDAWGWEAWRRWCDMAPADRVSGGYSYLESFKLLLREGGGAGGAGEGEEGGRLDTVCPLPAGLTAVQVAADFLGAMKRYILLHLQRAWPLGPSQPCPHPDLILWCLTLPAMWGEADKARVREAAKRAGLTRTLDSPSLLLTLEPEAAAVAAAVAGAAQQAAEAAAPAGSAEALPRTAIRRWLGWEPRQEQQQHDRSSADDGMPLLRRVGGGPAGASPSSPSPCLCPGDTLLVVDCGGGTVDVTMHSVMAGGDGAAGMGLRLADAAVGKGSFCGGRFVDEALWSLLRGALGADPWDTWREEHPADWTRLRDRWELAKRVFSGEGVTSTDSDSDDENEGSSQGAAAGYVPDDNTCGGMELPLPQSLVDALGPDRVQALQRPSPAGGSAPWPPSSRLWLRPDCRTLVVPGRLAARHVFGPVVARVVQLAAGVAAEGAEGGRAPNKVLLAGGFACSPFLQLAVRRELLPRLGRLMGRTGTRGGVELVLPQHPGAAVLLGAVLFGTWPERIAVRRCRLSYGIAATRPWSAADERSRLQHGYPRREHNDEDGTDFAEVFAPFVSRGQPVRPNETVERYFAPLYKSQPNIFFDLLATDTADATYTADPGVRRLGRVVLELPAGWAQCEEVRAEGSWAYTVQAEMLFGATELTLRACNPRTGQRVDMRVAWEGETP